MPAVVPARAILEAMSVGTVPFRHMRAQNKPHDRQEVHQTSTFPHLGLVNDFSFQALQLQKECPSPTSIVLDVPSLASLLA